jgi:hypothetical protein
MPTPRRISLLGRARRPTDEGGSGSADALSTPRRISLMRGGCIGAFHEEAAVRAAVEDVAMVTSKTMLGRLFKLHKEHHPPLQLPNSTSQLASYSAVSLDATSSTSAKGPISTQPGEEMTASSSALAQVGLCVKWLVNFVLTWVFFLSKLPVVVWKDRFCKNELRMPLDLYESALESYDNIIYCGC